MIYLDYNATAPVRPEVLTAMQPWLGGGYNPSSIHAPGRAARAAVEQARQVIAESLGVEATGVVFTASGTEAINHVLRGVGATAFFVSAIEHAAVLTTAAATGHPVHIIPVTAAGVVDLEALDVLLAAYPTALPLVSVMLANNETGVIQPVAEVAAIARRYGAVVHSDAVQAYGKIPFTAADLGVDFLTLSAHKCGGPIGAAALVMSGCHPVQPLLIGGGQERNQRAGTENVAAIVGFAAAVRGFTDMSHLAGWRDAMEAEALAYAPQAKVAGKSTPRLPNTSCLLLPGVENATQLMFMDLEQIAVSSGSACTSGKVERSHVLSAMHIAPAEADGAVRVSAGWASTEGDFQRFLNVWKTLADKKKEHAA